MATPDLSKLTAIIHTFERPQAVRRLLKSLCRPYPELKVLIADDSITPGLPKKVDHFRLPSEKGKAASLNALLARVRTPYFLLLDDRAEWNPATRIEELLALVANDQLDVAGGSTICCQRRFWFFVKRIPQASQAIFELAGDRLTLLPGHRSQGDGFFWCDSVSDFYVARTDKVRALGGWDPELFDSHREEFFFRAHRQGIRVGTSPEVAISVWSNREKLPTTATVRELRHLAVAKMGLAEMTALDGMVFKAPRMAQAA